MMVRRFLFGVAALPLLATVALAAQPLNDKQMDAVIAGNEVIPGARTQLLSAGPTTVASIPTPVIVSSDFYCCSSTPVTATPIGEFSSAVYPGSNVPANPFALTSSFFTTFRVP
jgi:hypothetical protein